jgi:hypothetical protein
MSHQNFITSSQSVCLSLSLLLFLPHHLATRALTRPLPHPLTHSLSLSLSLSICFLSHYLLLSLPLTLFLHLARYFSSNHPPSPSPYPLAPRPSPNSLFISVFHAFFKAQRKNNRTGPPMIKTNVESEVIAIMVVLSWLGWNDRR